MKTIKINQVAPRGYSQPAVYFGMKLMVLSLDERRKHWICHWKQEARRLGKWVRWRMCGPFYSKPLPEICKGLICGAKTRSGTPCKRHDISKQNGRCKLHGGHSTGPKTQAGKARVSQNLQPIFKHTPWTANSMSK